MRKIEIADEQASGCPFHKGETNNAEVQRPSTRKSDDTVLAEMLDWMKNRLPCVAGRREFNRWRYMIRVVSKDTVKQVFAEYKAALEKGEALACLFVFNDERFYEGHGDVSSAFYYLADQISPLGDKSAHALANGEALTNSILLNCPVTNRRTLFDDFECIAFCPQSSDPDDPLYDPLMYAPFPVVNMSSDVFAFSTFVSDNAQTMLGHRPFEEPDMGKLDGVFAKCVTIWQRVATTTIKNYEALTDVSLCPVHVSEHETHWVAGHKDPAFAEQVKEAHEHELPIMYGKRIIEGWKAHFSGDLEYSACGLARDGAPV